MKKRQTITEGKKLNLVDLHDSDYTINGLNYRTTKQYPFDYDDHLFQILEISIKDQLSIRLDEEDI